MSCVVLCRNITADCSPHQAASSIVDGEYYHKQLYGDKDFISVEDEGTQVCLLFSLFYMIHNMLPMIHNMLPDMHCTLVFLVSLTVTLG